jgi:hypothetical protein
MAFILLGSKEPVYKKNRSFRRFFLYISIFFSNFAGKIDKLKKEILL